MNGLPLRIWESLRSSYWFVPAIMASVALLLGIAAVWFDTVTGNSWLHAIGWAQQSKPDAAREMLSAIASSMITVAGVVFSITIVAIGYAAGQYGPRVLTNFMSDRGNQLTLGTFIATFVYSLLVMRTIHSGQDEFVPQFAVMFAIVLALCSIAVLIYFIHHVPMSIHVNSVIARVGKELLRHIGSEKDADSADGAKHSPKGDPRSLAAGSDDYVQSIAEDNIVRLASQHDLFVEVCRAPGTFVTAHTPILRIYPAGKADSSTCKSLRDAFVFGTQRTPAQDPMFLADELVQIAARALSTGVNDPYTAMTALDWLGAAIARMACAGKPTRARYDKNGNVRLTVPVHGFSDFVSRCFGRLRPYAARDPNVTIHTLEILADIKQSCRNEDQAQLLSDEAKKLVEAARPQLDEPDRKAVEQIYSEVSKKLREDCGA